MLKEYEVYVIVVDSSFYVLYASLRKANECNSKVYCVLIFIVIDGLMTEAVKPCAYLLLNLCLCCK